VSTRVLVNTGSTLIQAANDEEGGGGLVGHCIDREFVTSTTKKSRILTNFPKLKKFVKIRTKIR